MPYTAEPAPTSGSVRCQHLLDAGAERHVDVSDDGGNGRAAGAIGGFCLSSDELGLPDRPEMFRACRVVVGLALDEHRLGDVVGGRDLRQQFGGQVGAPATVPQVVVRVDDPAVGIDRPLLRPGQPVESIQVHGASSSFGDVSVVFWPVPARLGVPLTRAFYRPTMRRTRSVAAVVLGAALIVAACGGDENSSPDDTPLDGEQDAAAREPAADLRPFDATDEGFVVQIPASWELLDLEADDLAAALESIGAGSAVQRQQISTLIDAGAVMFAANPDDFGSDFASNLFVIKFPRDGETAGSLLETVSGSLESQATVLAEEVRPFGGGELGYISYEFGARLGGSEGDQYMYVADQHVYSLTMSTRDRARDQATFDAVAANFELAGDARPFVLPTPTPVPSQTPVPTATPTVDEATDADGDGIYFTFDTTTGVVSEEFDVPRFMRARYMGDAATCSPSMVNRTTGRDFSVFNLERGFVRVELAEDLNTVMIDDLIGCADGQIEFFAEPPFEPLEPTLDADGALYVHASGPNSENFAVEPVTVVTYDGTNTCSFNLLAPQPGEQSERAGRVDLSDATTAEITFDAPTVVFMDRVTGCRNGVVTFSPA